MFTELKISGFALDTEGNNHYIDPTDEDANGEYLVPDGFSVYLLHHTHDNGTETLVDLDHERDFDLDMIPTSRVGLDLVDYVEHLLATCEVHQIDIDTRMLPADAYDTLCVIKDKHDTKLEELDEPDLTNEDRAEFASEGLRLYQCHKEGQLDADEPLETIAVDFITDLLHLCNEKGLDFECIRRIALTHYHEEIA